MKNSFRMYHIDALRLLSTFYIIFFWHIDDYVNNCFYTVFAEITMYGALHIFVFISGYLLIKRNWNFVDLKEVYQSIKGRFLRVYPLFAVTLLLYCLIVKESIPEIIYALLMINMFVGDSVGTYWFVTMLLFYNLIAIFLLYKFSWKKFFWANIIVITVLLTGICWADFDKRLLYYYPSLLLSFVVVKDWKYKNAAAGKSIAVSSFILCLAIVICLYLWGVENKTLLCCAGFLMVLPLFRFFKEKLNFHNKYIELLSYSSFCMYLLHRIVYAALLLTYYPEAMRVRLPYLVFVGIPCVICLSFFLQYSYDNLLGRGKEPADYRPLYRLRIRRA